MMQVAGQAGNRDSGADGPGQGRLTGRGAAARKYDLLTILSVHALAQGKDMQRRCLRLMALVTARYNWQSDQLSIGQEEIARLWSVDLRTVKREMALFRNRGWLIEKRPAARGRVTLYGLGVEAILTETRPSWDKAGADLTNRLQPEEEGAAPDPGANVIPFPQVALPEAGQVWPRMAQALNSEAPDVYRAWFATLQAVEGDRVLTLVAPGSFHADYLRSHHEGRLTAALSRIATDWRLNIQC